MSEPRLGSDDPAVSESPRSPRGAPRALLVALGVAVVAAVVAVILLSTGGETNARLDTTKLTLELAYPTGGNTTANLEGQPGAAPPGAPIACRSAGDRRRLGEGTADDNGSFDVAIDPSAYPREKLTGDTYNQLNGTIECRAGDGPWVQPLRPPRVAIE